MILDPPQSADCTQQVQSALDANAEVVLPEDHDYPVKMVQVRKPQNKLRLDAGASLIGTTYEYADSKALLVAETAEHVEISGEGSVVVFHDDRYAGQHRPCVQIAGGSIGTHISGVQLSSAHGDGITIHAEPDQPPPRDIQIVGVTANRCWRNGISVSCVDGLDIEDCVLTCSRGVAAMAGLAIEPDIPAHVVRRLRMTDSQLTGHERYAFQVQLMKHGEQVDAQLKNCHLQSLGRPTGVYPSSTVGIFSAPPAGDNARIIFDRCIIDGGEGPIVWLKDVAGSDVLFVDCEFRRGLGKCERGDLRVEWSDELPADKVGSLTLVNCRSPHEDFDVRLVGPEGKCHGLRGTIRRPGKQVRVERTWIDLIGV